MAGTHGDRATPRSGGCPRRVTQHDRGAMSSTPLWFILAASAMVVIFAAVFAAMLVFLIRSISRQNRGEFARQPNATPLKDSVAMNPALDPANPASPLYQAIYGAGAIQDINDATAANPPHIGSPRDHGAHAPADPPHAPAPEWITPSIPSDPSPPPTDCSPPSTPSDPGST